MFFNEHIHWVFCILCELSVCFQGSNGAQSTKGGVGRHESERKGRDSYTHTTANQSDNRRKRPHHSSPENTPPQIRRQLEVFRHREDSLSGSSDSASDSEAEEEEEEDKEEEWEHNGSSKRLKTDTQTGSKKTGETGKVRNGRAVIQQLKTVVTSTTSSNVKTEQEMLGAGLCSAPGGRWSNTQSTRGINGSSPSSQDSESVTTEAPTKGLFSPASPISASPMPREDRSLHGGRTPDYELLQRLAVGGAAGRVLFHPLALGPPGPQSLYAPSTIRYAPPELPTAHAEGPRLDHAPKSPTFFPHLQRIAALPPFSGFSPSEPPFAPSLSFCMNGLRGAAGTDED